jgi:hypothetical protein
LRKFFHLALFLMAAALALVPVTAHATAYSGAGYSFDDSSGDGVLTVTTNDGTTDWRLNVSADVSAIRSVIFSEGVTAIGNNAFRSCDNLANVPLPAALTNIGNSAFYGCFALENVSFPSTLTSIGAWAFASSGLAAAGLSGTGVTEIGDSAFYNCTDLEGVSFPTTLTGIGGEAFMDCTFLAVMRFARAAAPSFGDNTVFDGIPSIGTLYYPEGGTNYTASYFNTAVSGGSGLSGWTFTPYTPPSTPTPNPNPAGGSGGGCDAGLGLFGAFGALALAAIRRRGRK